MTELHEHRTGTAARASGHREPALASHAPPGDAPQNPCRTAAAVRGHDEERRGRAKSRARRRAGYLAAVVVNAVMLWLAHSLLGWGWPPFLTPAFSDLLPFVDASLAATIAINLIWTARDPSWLRDLGQFGLDGLTAAAALRTWQIFPLDLSGSWSGWVTIARALLVIAISGALIDALWRLGALARLGGVRLLSR